MKNRILFTILVIVLMILSLSATWGFDTAIASSQTAISDSHEYVIAFQQPLNMLDPRGGKDSYYVRFNIFDYLIGIDVDGQLVPGLATSWTTSSDGKQIEFKLRKGVKFSSGDNFTAKDVAFSFNTKKKIDPAIQNQLNSQQFEKLEVIDDYTVKFYFSIPNINFLYQTGALFLPIFSKDYYDKVGEDRFVESPVGTGPFKSLDWKAGEYVRLEANEYYWGDAPQIKKAKFVVAKDSANRVAMLQSGEADIASGMPWQMVSILEKSGYNIVKLNDPHIIGIKFGLMNPNAPWAKLKVRQAINYAIDKDAVINKIYRGIPLGVEWLNEWELGYDASLKPAYPYNIEKAKSLMAEAGFGDGFEMPLYYNSGLVGGKDMLDYLSQTLLGLNIKITPIGLEGPENPATMQESHSDPTMLAVYLADDGICGNPDPTIPLTMYFHSAANTGQYATPELDKIVDQAVSATDKTARGKSITQAFKIIDSDLPVIPILQQVSIVAMKDGIDLVPTVVRQNGVPAILKDTKLN